MNVKEILEEPEYFAKEMVKDIRKRDNERIFGRHKCAFNLREVKPEGCSECEHLMEDLAHEGGMGFYICPFQSDTDILNYNLVCDKFELATTEPDKTERRKSMMDFTERLQYNSDNPGTGRLNILNEDEIASLMGSMENGELDEDEIIPLNEDDFQNDEEIYKKHGISDEAKECAKLFMQDTVVSISDEQRQMIDKKYLKNEITSLDDKIQYMKESIPGFIACTSDLTTANDEHKDSTLHALEMSFLLNDDGEFSQEKYDRARKRL